jgi:hypothetical protein
MKVPTSGTSVFQPFTYNNSAGGFTQTQNAGFATDFAFESDRTASANHYLVSRLQGPRAQMTSNSTLDEASYNTGGDQQKFDLQNLFAQQNSVDTSALLYCFRRAPSFFDVVCYTGTGANRTINHNLTVVPELIIAKGRNIVAPWEVYSAALANTQYMVLNTTAAVATGATRWNSTTPTSSVFSLGTSTQLNTNGSTYVAYLFATAPGVSKVGSYTGTGTTQIINCGFTAGARFVMIKRTNATGDWYVWDSARGIIAGNDPYMLMNSTAAEVTNTDYIDTAATGFEISSTAPAAINANGGSFIFLAIS